MAIITIFIEGGVLENENVAIQTLDNSQRLRESFYKLLSQRFDENTFSLEIEIGSSVNQTIKFFKKAILDGDEVFSIIDLDAPKNERANRIKALGIPNENMASRIIFMVQEMEAWILSQPDKIELCYQALERKQPGKKLSEDSILKDKDPESIVKPSNKLHTLLGRYFRIEKKGRVKKKKYNKLKDGGDLLELLDYFKLEQAFSDVKRLGENLDKRGL